MKKISVLLIGESWFAHIIEAKGFDSFSFDRYETAVAYIEKALSTEEISFTHMPCHEVEFKFPQSAKELHEKYDVILISDVGANTFLLPMDTFTKNRAMPNKLEIIKEFVADGGGFAMIGGYLTFMGFEAKGKFKDTAVEEILPITMLLGDDRVEKPQGFSPDFIDTDHEILEGIPADWPAFLGYNKLLAKESAVVLASYKGDPIIAVNEYGKGRTMAYATDCAPHWSSDVFCNWPYYNVLWQRIVTWLAKR